MVEAPAHPKRYAALTITPLTDVVVMRARVHIDQCRPEPARWLAQVTRLGENQLVSPGGREPRPPLQRPGACRSPHPQAADHVRNRQCPPRCLRTCGTTAGP